MSKFKVGDRVRRKDDLLEEDIVESVPGMKEYDDNHFLDADEGFVLERGRWEHQEYWELAKPVKTLDDITTLESGDIITGEGGYREILEVGKRTILASGWTTNLKEMRSCRVGAWYKPSELVNFGYKIYTPEETDDKTEEAMKLLKEKGYKIVKE